ncbi:MAG: stage II sporulation protein P [Clostridia bacterium]|nr:stage II sporulation protein P [Clostridia bacterium]
MFNVAVISLKSIVKFIIKIIITLVISVMIFNLFSQKVSAWNNTFDIAYVNIISNNLAISAIHEEENEYLGIGGILESELAIFGEINNKESIVENKEEIVENANEAIVENEEVIQNQEKVEENSEKATIQKLPTEVIEANNKKDVFTNTYGSVKIRNESKYELTDEMIRPIVDFNNKQDILIFHTHTCESYTPTENSNYVASGNFRTTDLNFSVAHVGETLTKNLEAKGYKVIHDQTYHDYPAYTGSYNRSFATVKKLLSGDAWTELVIDLHRDAMGSSSTYAPTVKIGEEVAAQIMFVMGTDGGGLEHPNWLNNFKLAVKIQEKANELYPGLFKPIILRNSRYNQNLASGACIIEVGATGNTLEQCDVSMKYLANVLSEVMK